LTFLKILASVLEFYNPQFAKTFLMMPLTIASHRASLFDWKLFPWWLLHFFTIWSENVGSFPVLML